MKCFHGVGERVRRRLEVAGDVLGQVGDVDRRPARIDDVDQHQRVVVGQVDDDVVRRVVGAVPGQLDPLTADLQGAAVLERLLVRGSGRVVVAQQQPPGLLVADANHACVEQRGRAGVVGVVVRVDQVGDGVADAVGGGDLVDGPLEVVADGRRRVEQDDAVGGGQERRLVGAVGDPVEVPLDPADVVALVVEGGAERRARDRRVVGQGVGAASAQVGGCRSCRFRRAHRALLVEASRGTGSIPTGRHRGRHSEAIESGNSLVRDPSSSCWEER